VLACGLVCQLLLLVGSKVLVKSVMNRKHHGLTHTVQPYREEIQVRNLQGHLVLGRTRWKHFGAVMVPATIAMTALMGGVASGTIPVLMTISGQTAMLSASKFTAKGFSQFPGVVVKKDGTTIPVAASQVKYAEIINLCQSVRIPGTSVTLFIRGGREAGKPVIAKDLLIGLDHLSGDAVFTNIDIGKDSSTLSKGGPPPVGLAGQFGQEADMAVITGVQQRFYSTHAGEFHLTGMSLNLKFDGSECFSTLRP
jgi:hypothetical protein